MENNLNIKYNAENSNFITKNRIKKFKIFHITKTRRYLSRKKFLSYQSSQSTNLKFDENNKNTYKINLTSKDFCGDYNEFEQEINEYPNSLIAITKDVYKFLKSNKKGDIKSLNDIIISNINSNERKPETISEKNIQRRVYDAINVMNAICIIKKDKNKLYFLGKNKMKSFLNPKFTLEQTIEKIRKKKIEMMHKKKELLTMYSKVICLFLLN